MRPSMRAPARPKAPLPLVIEWCGSRLLGIRVGDLRTSADWIEFAHRVRRESLRSSQKVVLCADLRGVKDLPGEGDQRLVQAMRDFNERILRSAIVVGSASLLTLRIERLLTDAGSDARKVCHDRAEASAWLSSTLDAEERRLLEKFLASKPTTRRPSRASMLPR